jgi:hypothetical protein
MSDIGVRYAGVCGRSVPGSAEVRGVRLVAGGEKCHDDKDE